MDRPLRIGLLGFGNVASATALALQQQTSLLSNKSARRLVISAVFTRSPKRIAGQLPDTCRVLHNAQALVNDPDVDVVLELMGGIEPAHSLVVQALQSGKHVVTANKALLATHGQTIFEIARQNGRAVLFEGAVAVAIPIVQVLRESAAANRISRISAILNGTCNYILSRMQTEGDRLDVALREAQRLGYAEADPSLDVSGQDARQKLVLLCALAMGTSIDGRHLSVQGIEALRPQDLQAGVSSGYVLRLVAHAEITSYGCMGHVGPTWVPASHVLAQVQQSNNGILIHGDLMGEAYLQGAGAGGRQTSSAVLADLLQLARGHATSDLHRSGPTGWFHTNMKWSPRVERSSLKGLLWSDQTHGWHGPYPLLVLQ